MPKLLSASFTFEVPLHRSFVSFKQHWRLPKNTRWRCLVNPSPDERPVVILSVYADRDAPYRSLVEVRAVLDAAAQRANGKPT